MYRRYVRARGRCPTSYTVGSVDFCIDELFKRPVFTDGQVPRACITRVCARSYCYFSPSPLSVARHGLWLLDKKKHLAVFQSSRARNPLLGPGRLFVWRRSKPNTNSEKRAIPLASRRKRQAGNIEQYSNDIGRLISSVTVIAKHVRVTFIGINRR